MRRFRFFTSTCTIIALLFSSMSPALATMQTGSTAASLTMEICQMQSDNAIALTLDLSSTSESAPSHPTGMNHDCPLCIIAHAPLALHASLATSVTPVGALSQAFPTLYYVSPKALFVWISQPARAPPSQL